MVFEELHQPGEIQQRTAQSIHLVDQYAINLAGLYAREKLLQCGTIDGCAAEPAIVVAFADCRPALLAVAHNAGFGRLALGLQCIELLLQSFLGGFARVDRAPHPRRLFSHASGSLLSRKKSNPFRRVSVTWQATALRESNFLPSYSNPDSSTRAAITRP